MSKINLEEVRKIVKLFDELKINKFRIKQKDFEIEVDRSNGKNIYYQDNHHNSKEEIHNSKIIEEEQNIEDDDNIKIVKAPIPGTFYRASTPNGKPFVEKGDKIAVGDVLGIVEAMKVMNKIESDVSGEVVDILHEDGKSVEYGTKLIKIQLK